MSPLQPKLVHAPEIGPQWLNSPPLSLRALRGRAVLVDFWDYTCVNCIRTLPYLNEWHRRYQPLGLTILGVHAPEFYFASVPELVTLALRDFGIEYPVMLDNDYSAWQAFANKYWPSKYLIDGEGYLRYTAFGEGHYGETEAAIQAVLRELDPRVHLPPLMEPVRDMDRPGVIAACPRLTPELYLGYARGRIANPEGLQEDRVHEYRAGAGPAEDRVELAGAWESRRDSLEAKDAARMLVPYAAAEVNAVLAASAEDPVARLEIRENGRPLEPEARGGDVREDAAGTFVSVDRPRMYSLVRRGRFARGVLELSTTAKDLAFFAFTYVSCPPGTPVARL